MTAKEKAKDLIVKLMEITPDYVIQDNKIAFELCKQHALITVDEIIKIALHYNDTQAEVIYWQEVKKELEDMK